MSRRSGKVVNRCSALWPRCWSSAAYPHLVNNTKMSTRPAGRCLAKGARPLPRRSSLLPPRYAFYTPSSHSLFRSSHVSSAFSAALAFFLYRYYPRAYLPPVSMGRKSGQELVAQAKAKGYQRGANQERDKIRNRHKHVDRTIKNHDATLDRYILIDRDQSMIEMRIPGWRRHRR